MRAKGTFIGQDRALEKDTIRQPTAQSLISPHGAIADIENGQSSRTRIFQKKGIRGKVKIAGIGVSTQADGEHCLDDDEAQDRVSPACRQDRLSTEK